MTDTARHSTPEDDARHPEQSESLWWIAVSPGLWAVHFLLSYITAAVYCARFAERADELGFGVGSVRWLIAAVYTPIAVAGIVWIGWVGWKRHGRGTETAPHDFDTPQDRHRFLGFSMLLLSGLSLVATLFTALVTVYFETCR